MDIIINSFSQNALIIMDALKSEIDIPHEYYDYFLAIRIGIFVALISTWIQKGKRESAEELVALLIEQSQALAKTNFLL